MKKNTYQKNYGSIMIGIKLVKKDLEKQGMQG